MQVVNQFPSGLITQYQNYFLELAYSSYLAPGVQIRFRAVEFDYGIILETIFFLRINEDHPKFEIPEQSVLHSCDISIQEAFKELHITISEFLSGEQQSDLNEAIEQNQPYFTGTVKLYDINNNKIFFIKEKKKELWSKEAAIQDIEKLINKARAMFSKLNH